MSLPVLRAIHELVQQGATLAGPKPTDDPSLADDQKEFHSVADELFGDGSGTHHVGKGTVHAGQTVGEAFSSMQVQRHFDYSKAGSTESLQFAERKLPTGELC